MQLINIKAMDELMGFFLIFLTAPNATLPLNAMHLLLLHITDMDIHSTTSKPNYYHGVRCASLLTYIRSTAWSFGGVMYAFSLPIPKYH